jgi:hypothetical protein
MLGNKAGQSLKKHRAFSIYYKGADYRGPAWTMPALVAAVLQTLGDRNWRRVDKRSASTMPL